MQRFLRAQHPKRFSVAATSTVSYNRKGDQPAIAPPSVKTISKTKSGLNVATIDNQGPTSSVAIYVKAGSRFDSAEKPGVAHLLQRSLIRNISGDNIVRTVLDSELRGNSLYSTVDREFISIGSEFLRDDVVDVVPSLISNLFNQSHEVYEFLRALDTTAEQTQSSLSDASTLVVDKLHQVAFRNGLGNPLFASPEALDLLKRADLQDRVKHFFTSDRIAVVATGVEHGELTSLVEKSLGNIEFSSSSSAASTKSVYYGGEARIEGGPKSTAIYAVAYPGVSTSSNDYAASLVLKALLGRAQRLKGISSSGLLGKVGSESAESSAFSYSYTDSGLIGFVVEGENGHVKDVVKKSIAALKSASSSISASAFEAAKKAATIDAEEALNRSGSLEALGKQATGGVAALTDVSVISSVSAADVQKIAKAALAAKPSIVAYGNLLRLPYASDL